MCLWLVCPAVGFASYQRDGPCVLQWGETHHLAEMRVKDQSLKMKWKGCHSKCRLPITPELKQVIGHPSHALTHSRTSQVGSQVPWVSPPLPHPTAAWLTSWDEVPVPGLHHRQVALASQSPWSPAHRSDSAASQPLPASRCRCALETMVTIPIGLEKRHTHGLRYG